MRHLKTKARVCILIAMGALALCFIVALLHVVGYTYNVKRLDSITGVSGVVVDGDHACLSRDSELAVLDLSHSTDKPVLVSSAHFPERAVVLAASGKFVYLTGWGGTGLIIVDISDIAAPRIISRLMPPDCGPNAAAVAGTLVFASNRNGLHVIDVSDPPTPRLLGSCHLPRDAMDIAVSGTQVLCACANRGLQIIDVSNPSAPAKIGTYMDTPPNYIRGVDVNGSTAFVASSWAEGSSHFQVVDLSNPARPVLLASLKTPGVAQDVAVAGSLAYVADRQAGMSVIDVSDPRVPRVCGAYRVGQAFSSKVSTSGSFVLLYNMAKYEVEILQYAPDGGNETP